MKKLSLLLFTALLMLFYSCKEEPAVPPIEVTPATQSSVARGYINEILSVMETNSLYRKTVDWSVVKEKALEALGNATAIDERDTYIAIREIFRQMEDNHSMYIRSDGAIVSAGLLLCEGYEFETPDLPTGIGYVKVNSFSGSVMSDAAIAFAEEIQNQISSQDSDSILGWVVDLRNNGGGNMWPMLAGVGPILGQGTTGYFVDANGNETPWGFRAGASVLNNDRVTELENSYQLINRSPKVAVLLNNAVGSSGEAIAVSFIKRPNTKSFGSPTCGIATSNRPFDLSSGSILNLTTAYFADREKNLFGVEVQPDSVVSNEHVVDAAVQWITEQKITK